MPTTSRRFAFLRPSIRVAAHACSFGFPLAAILPRVSLQAAALLVAGGGWLCHLVARERLIEKFHPAAWGWVFLASIGCGLLMMQVQVLGYWLLYLCAAVLLMNLCRLVAGLTSDRKERGG